MFSFAVAMGRVDGYFEQGPKPWDFVAAQVIVTEAGGHVMDLDGSKFDCTSRRILCTSTRALADQMIETLEPHGL